MTAFVLTGEGAVEASWIDENNHMNMMWYTHLIDQATQAMFVRMDLAVDGAPLAFVAARINVMHRRELRIGDPWQIWSGLAQVSERSMTFAHKLVSERAIVAKGEIVVGPFDRDTRTSIPLSEDVLLGAKKHLVPGLATTV